MKTAMIRANQKLVDDAYDHINRASSNLVMGISFAIGKEQPQER